MSSDNQCKLKISVRISDLWSTVHGHNQIELITYSKQMSVGSWFFSPLYVNAWLWVCYHCTISPLNRTEPHWPKNEKLVLNWNSFHQSVYRNFQVNINRALNRPLNHQFRSDAFEVSVINELAYRCGCFFTIGFYDFWRDKFNRFYSLCI